MTCFPNASLAFALRNQITVSEDKVGTVVPSAFDADSGKPIENVTFAIENSLAEMWAEPVGRSDLNGKLKLVEKALPHFILAQRSLAAHSDVVVVALSTAVAGTAGSVARRAVIDGQIRKVTLKLLRINAFK